MTRLRRMSGETFRSLHVRNFRLFFTGQLISQVGNWLTLIAETLLVLELTDSGFALGLLAAAQFGPVLFIGAFAGLVADRSEKRRLLLWVQTFAMFQSFALAALAFTGDPPVLAIYGVALLGGIATAFDNPARRSFVVEIVPEEDMTNAVSLNSALMTGARVVGPALAGLLVTTVGFGWAFALDGVSYLAVLVALLMMDPRQIRRAPVTPRGKGQVRDGLRYVRTIPELWVPLVMMAVIGTLSYNFQTVMPALRHPRHGRERRDLHAAHVRGQRRCAPRRAGRGAADERRHHRGQLGRAPVRRGHGPAHDLAEPGAGLRLQLPARPGQHHLHDDVDGHRPDPLGSDDAGSRARPPGHRVPGQHAHRRADRRLRVAALRRPVRTGHRRAGRAGCRRVRPLHGAPGRPRRSSCPKAPTPTPSPSS